MRFQLFSPFSFCLPSALIFRLLVYHFDLLIDTLAGEPIYGDLHPITLFSRFRLDQVDRFRQGSTLLSLSQTASWAVRDDGGARCGGQAW